MQPTEQEQAFVARRWKLVNAWPIVGSIAIAGVVLLAIGLWLRLPRLVDPSLVAAQIEAGALSETTLQTMAIILPVAMLACLFVLLVALGLAFVAFANERRHLAIFHRLTGVSPGARSGD